MPGWQRSMRSLEFLLMTKASATRRAKDVLLSLHVLSSVGWCMMQIAQLALLLLAWTSEGAARLSVLEITLYLEDGMLDPAAIIAAYTGIMLSAMTPWGFFRHWWVTTKFVLTLTAIVVASVVVSNLLPEVIAAASAGEPEPWTGLLVGTVGMTCATGFMIWVSVAKPWGKTKRGVAALGARRATRRKEAEPAWQTYIAVIAVPFIELGLRIDYPILTLGTVISYSAYKYYQRRSVKPPVERVTANSSS